MVPALSDAVLHPDMRLRRHAISALGTLGDARALPVLAGILRGEQEQPVFRGDALVAIYQIDRQAGLRLARKYQGRFPHVEDAIEIIGQMEAGTWRWTPGQEPRGWQRQARPGPA
jgi:HEAT repeat protein